MVRAIQTIHNMRALLPHVAGHRANTRRVRAEIRFLELYVQDLQEGYEVVKPSLTFADRHTLDLGDLTLELIFFGKGHSLSDILIHVPQERLLVTGAIVYQRAQQQITPYGVATNRARIPILRIHATKDSTGISSASL